MICYKIKETGTAVNVFAETACTGGAADALTEHAMTITEQNQILTTKHIQISRFGQLGAIGTNLANRHIGAEAEYYIRQITVSISKNTREVQ